MNSHIKISLFKIWNMYVYWTHLIYIKNHLNLFWSKLFMKTKIHKTCVLCTWAYQLFLSLQMDLNKLNTRIPKSSWRSSSSSRLGPKHRDPTSMAMKDLDARVGNHQVKASKLLFLKQSPTNILLNDLKLKSQDY